MLAAGVAWGIYSLRGKGRGDPINVTAGNFMRGVPLVLLVSVLTFRQMSLDTSGVCYAIASGALTSGIGYVIWYSALPFLKAAKAATVQLTVPVIAAFGGILFLGESVTMRLVLSAITILGGIALVIWERPRAPSVAKLP
jgi:drug/metabolite transporter (DMT)-like permease